MDTFPIELQVMVLKRTHCNALYYAQQVNKTWRCYILENGDKMRSLNIKMRPPDKQMIPILIECLHSSNSRKCISREAINSIKLTDFEVIRCMNVLFVEILMRAAFFRSAVLYTAFNYSDNAQNTLQFISKQVALLITMEEAYSDACELLQVNANLKENINILTTKCLDLIVLVRKKSPVANDIMFIHAMRAMDTIHDHIPGAEMILITEVLVDLNYDKRVLPPYSGKVSLEKFRKLLVKIIPFTKTVIELLNRGIEQFVRDLKAASLYNDE